MKKVFRIEDIDCANCARKIEDKIRGFEGVKAVSVNFLAEKLTLEAEDEVFDEVLKQAVKIAKRVEPDCTIIM